MVEKFKIILFLTLLTFNFTLLTSPTYAAQFSESFLRLDRTKTSSSFSGTVCAKPSSGTTGTENKVAITFPSDFTISTTPSNWTVTTTNFPSGATAWPGIGTAISVSGQTVTFPSSDLTNSTLYCFNFQSTFSSTSFTTGQKNGTIVTKSSSESVIDTNNFAVSIVSDDQIRVTANVAASTKSVQLDLASLNTGTEVSQDTFMDFELTYGSYIHDPINLTIEVEGRQGQIEGSGAPSIDVVDYVYGSATNAINGIPPIIDPVHKKIIWNIVAFPTNTIDKKVRFALHTNSAYAGTSKVNFSVSARIIGPGFVTPDKIITKTYKFNPSKVSSGPTATPVPGSTTSTPTTSTTFYTPGYIPPSVFRNIFIPSVSYQDARIFMSTFRKYFHSVRYGQTPTRLNNKVTSLNKTDKVSLDITDLEPDSSYYFKAEVKDESGKVTGTETFTFKTAEVSNKPEVEKSSLLVTSLSNVISTPSQTGEDGQGLPPKPAIVVPRQTAYEIRFALKKGQTAKKVQAIVRSKVLGISTAYAEEPNTETVDMIEVEPGVYAGSLKSKPQPGYYEQLVRIEDDKGNIAEEKVADIKVLKPFTVLSERDKNPIENARALFSIHNPKTRTYQEIAPNIIAIKNPSYTDIRGEINLVLPQGKYKALVSTLGYKETAVEFSIGINPDDESPQVFLEKEPFNLLNVVKYYGRTVRDVFLFNTKTYLAGLSTSLRFFNLIVAASFASLVLLTILSFSLRTHIPLIRIPKYLVFHLKKILPNISISTHIHGTIVDAHTKLPITQADIYIVDADKKVIVERMPTNKTGEFFSDRLPEGHYNIMVMKRGYEPSGSKEYPLPDGVPENFLISLHKNETFKQSIQENAYWAAENAAGFSFELLLITSLVLEVLFAYALGWEKTLPFFIVSFLNLTLWLLYLRHFFARKS